MPGQSGMASGGTTLTLANAKVTGPSEIAIAPRTETFKLCPFQSILQPEISPPLARVAPPSSAYTGIVPLILQSSVMLATRPWIASTSRIATVIRASRSCGGAAGGGGMALAVKALHKSGTASHLLWEACRIFLLMTPVFIDFHIFAVLAGALGF